MTQFERALNIIFGGLVLFENDPGFGYRMYRLSNEDQARVFRMARQKGRRSDEMAPPTTGKFVAVAIDPKTQKVTLAYGEFPKGGGESQYHAMLGYDMREYGKAPMQVMEYLTYGKIPVADGDYDEK